MVSRDEWLKSLKKGDKVVIRQDSLEGCYPSIFFVHRTTKTLVIVDLGYNSPVNFNRATGIKTGKRERYDRLIRIDPITDEVKSELNLLNLHSRFRHAAKVLHDREHVLERYSLPALRKLVESAEKAASLALKVSSMPGKDFDTDV